MNRSDIINYLIKKYSYSTYLEIGLDNPQLNFVKIDCSRKFSVDPYFEYDHDEFDAIMDEWLQSQMEEYLTYRMTSDEFFEKNVMKFDIIFIDGLHTKEQVSKDIINGLKALKPGGKIVVHDCLPKREESQKVPRTCCEWNGDIWRAIPELKKQNINFKTVDADYGCCIIDYTPNSLNYIDSFENDWNDFVNNRDILMNVISEDDFYQLY